jgi:hypothetical protein
MGMMTIPSFSLSIFGGETAFFVDSDAVQASLHSAYVLKIVLCHNKDNVWR